MRCKGISCAALGALLSWFSAGAQTFGEFTGRVADSTGAVIAGAKVTITNVATNVARATETNEAGNYTVPFVSPGVYDLQAETEGFKTALQEDWTLTSGRCRARRLQLGDRCRNPRSSRLKRVRRCFRPPQRQSAL